MCKYVYILVVTVSFAVNFVEYDHKLYPDFMIEYDFSQGKRVLTRAVTQCSMTMKTKSIKQCSRDYKAAHTTTRLRVWLLL